MLTASALYKTSICPGSKSPFSRRLSMLSRNSASTASIASRHRTGSSTTNNVSAGSKKSKKEPASESKYNKKLSRPVPLRVYSTRSRHSFIVSARRLKASKFFAFLNFSCSFFCSLAIFANPCLICSCVRMISIAGKITSSDTRSMERWLSTSKERIVSISSPQSSIRYGHSPVGG